MQHHKVQKVTNGFQGCLDAITVDEQEVVVLPKIKKSRGLVEEAGIRQCCPHTGACSSSPCLNDGLCAEMQGGGKC